jgi:hypothetical protein
VGGTDKGYGNNMPLVRFFDSTGTCNWSISGENLKAIIDAGGTYTLTGKWE